MDDNYKHLDPAELSVDRQSFLQVTRELAALPLPQSTAILETGAAIGAISMRTSVEFLRASVEAARVLDADELRNWGELGRRLAMSDVETAISFFKAGVDSLQNLSVAARAALFQLCSRQIGLSTSIAAQTFQKAPPLAQHFSDQSLFTAVIEVASDIARRSARHSADFLDRTPEVVASLKSFSSPEILHKGITLATSFAARAGGISTDAWVSLPQALHNLNDAQAVRLLDQAMAFLERGGGAALQMLLVGGEILRLLPETFDEWLQLLWSVAQHGNASLVAFVRSSPRFVRGLISQADHQQALDLARRVIRVTRTIAQTDGE